MSNVAKGKKKGIPLYQQVFSELKKTIEDGQLKNGDTFYSESELQKMFSVSRITVREAMRLLENYGYIRRSQGAPTIVTKSDAIIWDINDITQDTKQKSDVLHSKIISIEKVKPEEDVKLFLRLSDDDFVYRIERVRSINDIKLTHSISHIAPWAGVDFTEIDFNSNSSIYDVLREYGEKPETSDETIEAVNGSKYTCDLLDLPENHALFFREKITYNSDKKPIEYVWSYYNAKYTKYYLPNKIV